MLGYVVDGGSRDTDLVLEQGFPVFCSFLTPSGHRRALDSRPLTASRSTIGDVTIATGDYLLGDRDGVVDRSARRLPRRSSPATEEVVATESDMRKALIGGLDPIEAYNTYGKF